MYGILKVKPELSSNGDVVSFYREWCRIPGTSAPSLYVSREEAARKALASTRAERARGVLDIAYRPREFSDKYLVESA